MARPAMVSHDEMKSRGYRMRDPGIIFLCYDPAGEGDDNDALVMVQREEWRRGELVDPDMSMEFMFRVLMAEYMPSTFTFSQKVARIITLNKAMRGWQNKGKSAGHFILVESNGVGYAAASFLNERIATEVITYNTVARLNDDTYQEGRISMPRLTALDHARMWLDLERIKMVPGAPGAREMVAEMNSLVWAGPKRPEAMEGQRDDMFMALTSAVWFGTKLVPPVTRQVKVTTGGIDGSLSVNGTRILN